MAFINKAAKQKLFRQHKQLQNRVRLDGCYVICSDPYYGPGGSQTEEPEGISWHKTRFFSIISLCCCYPEPDGDQGWDNYVPGEDKPIEIIYVPTATEEDKRPHQIYNNYDFPPYFDQQPDFGYGFQSWDDKKQKRKHSEKKHWTYFSLQLYIQQNANRALGVITVSS